MSEMLLIWEMFLPVLLTLAWSLAARSAGRIGFWEQAKKRKRKARWTLGFVAAATVLTVAELAVWLRMGFHHWLFVQDRLLLVLPLFLLPAAFTLSWTVPILRRIARGKEEQPGADERYPEFAPQFLVPVRAAALGAAAGTCLMWFRTGIHGDVREAIASLALFGLAVGALWALQLRRWRQALRHGSAPMRPGRMTRFLRNTAAACAVILLAAIGLACAQEASKLPGAYSMADHENADFGRGHPAAHGSGHARHVLAPGKETVSVTKLTGPRTGEPDARFTLVARKQQMRLSSGKTVEAWTFNGQLPGPELRVRQGDLVEVTLINEDIQDGVTIHWHGVNVPNAEDGVAGVTQDAVMPGERHTYRFVAEQPGTFWYHSHQQSSQQVKKGLFGPLVILPAGEPKDDGRTLDITTVIHRWETTAGMAAAFDRYDTLQRKAVKPGTTVRLRLVNADSFPAPLTLTGAPFRVVAIDGNDLNGPTDLTDTELLLAGGGRYDITFVMPNGRVQLTLRDWAGPLSLLFSPDGTGEALPVPAPGSVFDPAAYGELKPVPFDRDSRFDREFAMVFDNRLGFYDGRFNVLWTINGKVFPHAPTLMVREGDLVKTTFVNRSGMDHPMHLHGHHMLVLSRNGKPVTGSPWWTDTLNVAPGETYEVAFRADNPGIWMDHCHNLYHAAFGMTLHLSYEGVTSPFMAGRETRNQPE